MPHIGGRSHAVILSMERKFFPGGEGELPSLPGQRRSFETSAAGFGSFIKDSSESHHPL
jgi:hypothetical protein